MNSSRAISLILIGTGSAVSDVKVPACEIIGRTRCGVVLGDHLGRFTYRLDLLPAAAPGSNATL